MKGQGAMDHRDKARDNGEHEDSAEPSVRQMASGPAERAIFGRRGPWGFLGLVAAISSSLLPELYSTLSTPSCRPWATRAGTDGRVQSSAPTGQRGPVRDGGLHEQGGFQAVLTPKTSFVASSDGMASAPERLLSRVSAFGGQQDERRGRSKSQCSPGNALALT